MARSQKTQFTILGMLSIEPMSGYDIKHMISTSTSHFWSESDGQIYPALTDLLKQGMISEIAVQKNSARKKRVYRLAPKGKKHLIEWLQQEPEKTLVRNELMLKLFFGKNNTNLGSIEHVRNFQQIVQKKLAIYQRLTKKLETDERQSPHSRYWLMTLSYGRHMMKSQLQWCKETLALLEA